MHNESGTTRPDPPADRVTVVTGTVHPRPGRQHRNSGRQIDAALAAASSEDAATGTGAHAGTEAVVTGTTTVAGLESALHGMFSLVSWGSPGGSTRAGPSGAPGWAQGKWTLETATGKLYVVGALVGKLTVLCRQGIE